MGSTPTRKNNEIIKTKKREEEEELNNSDDDNKSKLNDTGEMEINIYKLIWEQKFTTLILSNISFELISKKGNKLIEIFQKSKNNIFKSYTDELSTPNTLLFYIYIPTGIIITKKYKKAEKILLKLESKIIKISLVDYSFIKNKYPEFFSLYQIKIQTKLFYDLSTCKIDLTKRIGLYTKGRNQNLSDEEILLDDVEQTIKHPRNDELIIQSEMNNKINKEVVNYLYEIKNNLPYEKIIDLNKIHNYNEKENGKENNENEYNLIKVFLNKRVPIEKKKQKNVIEKIVIKNIDFRNMKMYNYYKDCIYSLIGYRKLKKFAFYYNNIPFPEDNKIWNYISKLINENFHIRWINLKYSCLNDTTIKLITTALKMKRIRFLDLTGNNLTDNSMKLLDKFLEENKTLKRLFLMRNKITTNGLIILQHSIIEHPNLNTLGLSYLNLENSGDLIKSLLKNGKIKHLFVRGVTFNKRDFIILSQELGNNQSKLTYLDISFNSLPDSSQNESIGNIILKNTSIKKLCLDGMNLNLQNYMPIFKSIFKNRTIECYSFNQNEKLPMKGILNFFMKINYIKELSLIPWDINKEKNRTYSQEEIKWLKIFHKNNPNIKIHGVGFK